MKGTGRLKVFRTEAVRAGFDRCWMQRDFETIVKVASAFRKRWSRRTRPSYVLRQCAG